MGVGESDLCLPSRALPPTAKIIVYIYYHISFAADNKGHSNDYLSLDSLRVDLSISKVIAKVTLK